MWQGADGRAGFQPPDCWLCHACKAVGQWNIQVARTCDQLKRLVTVPLTTQSYAGYKIIQNLQSRPRSAGLVALPRYHLLSVDPTRREEGSLRRVPEIDVRGRRAYTGWLTGVPYSSAWLSAPLGISWISSAEAYTLLKLTPTAGAAAEQRRCPQVNSILIH